MRESTTRFSSTEANQGSAAVVTPTNGAELAVTMFEALGVEVVFGLPGGPILPFYDALRTSGIRHVLARHEQGAGFMAQGYARASGRPGVCVVSSGPGVLNLITAIADADRDSIPLIAVCGQVPASLIGTDAFQEVDTIALMASITKQAWQPRSVEDLADSILEAWCLATTGRPGPVVIDLPKNVQTASVGAAFAANALALARAALSRVHDNRPGSALYRISATQSYPKDGSGAAWGISTAVFSKKPKQDTTALIRQSAALIDLAERPVILAGAGLLAAMRRGYADSFHFLHQKSQIPVVMTFMGLGAIEPENPASLGMIGMHGGTGTNHLMREADLVIALGARLDDRATGKLDEFCPDAKLVHIDIDPSELGKLIEPTVGIAADLCAILPELAGAVTEKRRPEWMARVAQARKVNATAATASPGSDKIARLFHAIDASFPEDTIFTTDVGQHQMWAAQFLPVRCAGKFISSGGMGTMGFGLPAAIGAAHANPGKRVVCISGDGSFYMNVQELATLRDLGLPVTILVLDNGGLGLVRQQQSLNYGSRHHAERYEPEQNIVAIARGFGIAAQGLAQSSIGPRGGRSLSLAFARARQAGPSLVAIEVPFGAMALPMVPPGGANHIMIGGIEALPAAPKRRGLLQNGEDNDELNDTRAAAV